MPQPRSHRPDLLGALSPAVPGTFDEVLQLGEKARKAGKCIAAPACPTDAISLLLTLSSNLGYPALEEGECLVDDSGAAEVLDRLHSLIDVAHPRSVEWNPIQVYDFMITRSDAVYCPYAFGYSNYLRVGNSVRLRFMNAPAAGRRGCAGTMLPSSRSSRNRSKANSAAHVIAGISPEYAKISLSAPFVEYFMQPATASRRLLERAINCRPASRATGRSTKISWS